MTVDRLADVTVPLVVAVWRSGAMFTAAVRLGQLARVAARVAVEGVVPGAKGALLDAGDGAGGRDRGAARVARQHRVCRGGFARQAPPGDRLAQRRRVVERLVPVVRLVAGGRGDVAGPATAEGLRGVVRALVRGGDRRAADHLDGPQRDERRDGDLDSGETGG